MKRAALHNLGCKVNTYETEAMQQLLEDAGFLIVDFNEKADVYIINTCSVTNIADRKSRQMLHRARRLNPEAIVVAAGCYAQNACQDILKEGMADIVLGNNKKKHLISVLEEYRLSKKTVIDWEDINDGKKEYEQLSISRTAEHTRAFIKIQDGCNQFCSYCIIPYARGRIRSRKPEDILAEIHTLSMAGYKEIVLTGIHLSSYGADFHDQEYGGNVSLLQLLAQIHQIEGIARIRLGSLEPSIVTEQFASALAGMEKICPHFHLSLQSGCNSVLKRMNRRYLTEDYEERCKILRKYFENPAITTDVIVGFPGETEEEFQETRRFLKKIELYEMHIFKYSKRKGTKAAEMDGQVPETVKTRRSAQLIALGEELSQAYRQSFVGHTVQALLEEPFIYEGKTYYTGYTKEYIKIAVEDEKNRSNSFSEGKIIRYLVHDIYLMVEF